MSDKTLEEEISEHEARIEVYLIRVAELCEGLERDIKNGKVISSDTVLRLSRLISATNDASLMWVATDYNNNKKGLN
jgi:hypothetical protein